MEKCKVCGKKISWVQHEQHKGLCPECFRLDKYGSTGKTCHVCDKLAFEKCYGCGSLICKDHTYERSYPPMTRGRRQCKKCWRKTNIGVLIFVFVIISAFFVGALVIKHLFF